MKDKWPTIIASVIILTLFAVAIWSQWFYAAVVIPWLQGL